MKTLRTILGTALITVAATSMAKTGEPVTPLNKESTAVQVSESEASWNQELKSLIAEFPYSEKTAEDFERMVSSWKTVRGEGILNNLDKRLRGARQSHQDGQMSLDKLVELEVKITSELATTIQYEIRYKNDDFDLETVIGKRSANCFGYSQTFFFTSRTIGLEASVIKNVPEKDHVANIVRYSNGTMRIVDLIKNGVLSEPIIIGKGGWVFNKSSITNGNETFDLLDEKKLKAELHFCRGTILYTQGKAEESIPHYNKALELNPEDSRAYNNRGGSRLVLGEHTEAINDFNKAIELDPGYVNAYHNRANAFLDSEQYDAAIIDYTKVLELDSGFVKSYFGRAFANMALGNHVQTIADFTSFINSNPGHSGAYFTRGVSFASLENPNFERANQDWSMALALDPNLKEDINRVSRERFGNFASNSYGTPKVVSVKEEKPREHVRVAKNDSLNVHRNEKAAKVPPNEVLTYYQLGNEVYALFSDHTLRWAGTREIAKPVAEDKRTVKSVLNYLMSPSHMEKNYGGEVTNSTKRPLDGAYRDSSGPEKKARTVGEVVRRITTYN